MNSKSSYLLPFLLLCNSRNRSHKLWIGRVVIFAFCCTFCLLDIIHNVLFFLQRPFTVNIHLDYDQPIALPSLTICIPNIVDLPQLRQQYPAVYEKYVNISWDKYYWRPRFAAEFTIGQLRQMQPKQEQILVNCTLLSSRLTPMPCTQITPVQRFFSMGKYCYTYFEQHPQLLNNISNQSNVSAIDISNSSASSKTTKKSATDAGNKLGGQL